MKIIAYFYIHFDQNLDKKSYVSTKIETVTHLHVVFLHTAEECQGHC